MPMEGRQVAGGKLPNRAKNVEEGTIMCFRPSALAGNEPQVQMGTCPSCGQPVAASVGIVSGECPHCGKPIPTGPEGDKGVVDPTKNTKIL